MATATRRFVVFLACASAVVSLAAHRPVRRALPDALPNENRTAAGRFSDGLQTIELETAEANWHLEGKDGPALRVFTFAEKGKAPSIPGPLIRVSAGTELRVRIHNGVGKLLVLRGLQDHAAAGGDTVMITADETRELRFRADIPGTYFYWGRTEGDLSTPVTGGGHDSQLMGAFIVDPVGMKPAKNERVLIVGSFGDTVGSLGLKSDKAFELLARFGVKRDTWLTWTVNGLAWPYTERLSYTVGDTVRWRVINAGRLTHPMHLHGFYFDVLSRGDATRDTNYSTGERRKAVTEPLQTRTSMMIQWVPTRPGNWLFHCHLIDHIDGALRFGAPPPAVQGHHAEQEMAGLVMGLNVRPAAGTQLAGDPVARRKLRVFVNERPNVYGNKPGYSYVLQEGATPPAADSIRLPSSTIVLHRNEPTEITVINHSHAMASIHWHGIELESFYDGVGDWSGSGTRTAPPIAPGDSFIVRMTPDRAGTFIYHTHSDETEQLPSGLYGPLIVLAENAVMDTTQRVFLMGAGGPQDGAPAFLNGSATPPPIEIRAGATHRFRFINIASSSARYVRLVGDSIVTWRAVSKDGADLPVRQAVLRTAVVALQPGETYDFDVSRAKQEVLRLEIATGPTAPPMKVPLIVR